MNEELKKGDTVQVLKSGKLYRLKGIDSDGSYFQQWRPDRMSYYGPSFIFLKPGRYKKIEVSWPEPQRIPPPPRRQPSPKPVKSPKSTPPDLEAQIKEIEKRMQFILDDLDFMEYLKSYPWPDMGPGGTPTMEYTAYDHLVVNLDRRIRYYRERNDNRGYLSLLKSFLPMLRHEQLKLTWREP